MAYIGTDINYGNIASMTGVGDGTTTPIATLDYSVPTSASIIVTLDGVTQVPVTNYVASGTTLTFDSAVASPIAILVVFLGRSLDIGTPADGTVTNAKVDGSAAIATSKLSGAVTSIPSHGLGALASLATVGNSQIDNNAVDEDKLKDALIPDFTEVTVATGDSILLGDATDSGNTKRDTVQGILDLVPAAGADTSLSNLSATGTNKIAQVWVNFNGLVFATRDSLNVSSVTDNGTGDYTVNFTSSMPDTNYAVVGCAGDSTDTVAGAFVIATTYATGSVRIKVLYAHANVYDRRIVCIAVFGD
jgi:hypothetical protein